MILIVDDDPAMLAYVGDTLEADGLSTIRFSTAREALAYLDKQSPALVISDVKMPELSGLELKQHHLANHPGSETTFVFLSSIADEQTIVRGLDDGAEDYLLKPISPEMLTAKVRSLLRRRQRRASQLFRGNLAQLPLAGLLGFCEGKGLTGHLDVFHAGKVTTLRFVGGQLHEEDAERCLDEVLPLTEGVFELRSVPAALDELKPGGPGASVAPRHPPDGPIGRVSGVRLNERLLQVQTQLAGGAEPFVVTLVTIEGKVAWKRRTACSREVDGAELQKIIDEQHDAIEREVEAKLAAAAAASSAEPRADFHRLCDEGYDRFRAGDYERAVACWRGALAIDPSAGAIAVNLKVATERLNRSG